MRVARVIALACLAFAAIAGIVSIVLTSLTFCKLADEALCGALTLFESTVTLIALGGLMALAYYYKRADRFATLYQPLGGSTN